MTREYFVLLYQHSNWANRRIRGLLRDQSRENERARELFSHLLVGEKVWMRTLRGKDSSSIPMWPDLSLDECATLVE